MEGALSNAYHVYAIEWTKDRIDWYVDNNLYFTATAADVAPNKWVFNNEFYLIINLATGGNFEPNIDPMLQQATMSIDYIRYYTKDGQGKLYKRK
jgi:beta-glucanase (GH16 family)